MSLITGYLKLKSHLHPALWFIFHRHLTFSSVLTVSSLTLLMRELFVSFTPHSASQSHSNVYLPTVQGLLGVPFPSPFLLGNSIQNLQQLHHSQVRLWMPLQSDFRGDQPLRASDNTVVSCIHERLLLWLLHPLGYQSPQILKYLPQSGAALARNLHTASYLLWLIRRWHAIPNTIYVLCK